MKNIDVGLIKLDTILEIKNVCNGRIMSAPYISQGYLTAYKNSVQDGTWKITKTKKL